MFEKGNEGLGLGSMGRQEMGYVALGLKPQNQKNGKPQKEEKRKKKPPVESEGESHQPTKIHMTN